MQEAEGKERKEMQVAEVLIILLKEYQGKHITYPTMHIGYTIIDLLSMPLQGEQRIEKYKNQFSILW